MPSDEIVRLLCMKSDLKDLSFLNKCLSLIDSGKDFPVAWKMSLEDKSNTLFMRDVLFHKSIMKLLSAIMLNHAKNHAFNP